MPQEFATPQDAEDAYYDAIEDGDLSAMLAVWETSDDVVCLLPMQPLVQGHGKIREVWGPLLQSDVKVDIEVLHFHWIEAGDLAIHYLREKVNIPDQPQQQPPIYATNVYRKDGSGWHMILHQNSPAAPPPGMMPGMPPQ
jgi:uncharacterized protein (TIGR02246 family)